MRVFRLRSSEAIVLLFVIYCIFYCEYNSVQRLLQSWPVKLVFEFYAQQLGCFFEAVTFTFSLTAPIKGSLPVKLA
jgi:hypothetical protein